MFKIVADTREQQPWEFRSKNKESLIVHRKLDTGDYTVEGLEGVLCIERKKTVAELAGNITEARFHNELERMKAYPYSYCLLEFGLDDIIRYPVGSDIPKRVWEKLKIKGPFIMKVISDMQVDYDVHIIPCGNTENAEWIAFNLMRKVHDTYDRRRETEAESGT